MEQELWKASPDRDFASPPPWAAVRGSTSVRQKNAASLCAYVFTGDLPPVLINRHNRTPARNPAYVIPAWLWNLIYETYDDMKPMASQIYEATASYYRNRMGANILEPAFHEGQHTYVYSVGNPTQEDLNSWEVYFSPRVWVETGVDRLKDDELIDKTQYEYWVRRAGEDREHHIEATSPATQAEVDQLRKELASTRAQLTKALDALNGGKRSGNRGSSKSASSGDDGVISAVVDRPDRPDRNDD